MAVMDYEACYTALELNFGAGLKEVNERWRKLSRIHHPDRHARDPKAYHKALEKQKQLNNAHDILKKWFEVNPHATPPKSNRSSNQSGTHSRSRNSQSANNNAGNSSSQQRNGPGSSQTHHQSSHAQNHHSHHKADNNGESAESRSTQSSAGTTGWFRVSQQKLTPLQELVQKIDVHCSGDSPSFLAMILCFAAVFGPMWIIAGTISAIFPELPGHYPDWLMAVLLFASGRCTWYAFRWFFAEAELIKLQQREMYFKSNRTLADTVQLARRIISKQVRPNTEWKFTTSGTAQEASIEFEEEVLPEVKRSRHLVFRFEARPGTYSVELALEVKVRSPLNSFSCKHIAETVVSELKKELQQIAA